MNKPDLSIIIVNWKVKDLLKKCLDSIFAYKKKYNIEIFVVDNDSRDGSVEMIRNDYSSYKELRLLALDKNIGFARANNLAIKQAWADYIFLLNPDTELSIDFLDDIFNYIKNHKEPIIVGPKIVNEDFSVQDSVRRFPTFFSQFLILLKLKNVLVNNKILSEYLCQDFDYNKEQSVDQIMGAAMFIPKVVLDKIGLFDEKFFIWFEEVDLCKRARQSGIDVRYFPGAKIIHQGGRSFSKSNIFRNQFIFNKSLLYYFFKHKPFIQSLALLCLVPLNIILTLFYVIFIPTKTK